MAHAEHIQRLMEELLGHKGTEPDDADYPIQFPEARRLTVPGEVDGDTPYNVAGGRWRREDGWEAIMRYATHDTNSLFDVNIRMPIELAKRRLNHRIQIISDGEGSQALNMIERGEVENNIAIRTTQYIFAPEGESCSMEQTIEGKGPLSDVRLALRVSTDTEYLTEETIWPFSGRLVVTRSGAEYPYLIDFRDGEILYAPVMIQDAEPIDEMPTMEEYMELLASPDEDEAEAEVSALLDEEDMDLTDGDLGHDDNRDNMVLTANNPRPIEATPPADISVRLLKNQEGDDWIHVQIGEVEFKMSPISRNIHTRTAGILQQAVITFTDITQEGTMVPMTLSDMLPPSE